MDYCSASLPAGINQDCLAFLYRATSVIIAEAGVSFTSESNFIAKSAWETKIKQNLSVYAPALIAGYERTTPDPTVSTTGLGRQVITGRPVPSARVFLESNICDYAEIKSKLKGGKYSVFFVLENGALYGRRGPNGVVYGFSARINATGLDVPIPDSVENSYPVYLNFLHASEFNAPVVKIPDDWNPEIDLAAAMPLGLSMFNTAAYSSSPGTITVKITERCGDVYNDSGLAFGDFEVVNSSDLVSPAVTAVDATSSASGLYTITVKKGASPVSLASGDWVTVRVKILSSSDVTHISNNLVVKG